MPELFDLLYQQLKGLARNQLRKRASGATLCTTELVHELYLRYTRHGTPAPWDRSHFMALSARAMRQIVIDHARLRMAQKRGGDEPKSVLDETLAARNVDVEREASFLLALDQALQHLEVQDPRLASVSELRFFGGYSVDETAEVLKVSTPTVKRDTRLARAFLARALDALGEGRFTVQGAA